MSKPTIADQLHLAGQIEQARIDGKPVEWQVRNPKKSEWERPAVSNSIVYYLDDPPWEIRLKPALKQVPLGAEDVPPGSVFRFGNTFHWINPIGVAEDGLCVYTTDALLSKFTWACLLDMSVQINSSIPLTGKWDPNAWRPCCKSVEEVPV